MTNLQMQTKIRLLLGETTTSTADADATAYLDAEIQTQINDSAIEVAKRLRCLQTYKDADCVIDQERYALPPDLLSLKDVQLIISSSRKKQLVQLTYDEYEAVIADNYTATGEPKYFKVEFGSVKKDSTATGDIWVYPLPDSTDYDLRVAFFQKPSTLADNGDVCELPEQTHMTVCYHAAMILSRKIDDLTRFREISALFADSLRADEESIHMQDVVGAVFGKNHYITKTGWAKRPHPGFRR